MVVLAGLVVAVFHPVVGFEFINADTPEQVVENSHIRGLTLENVQHIFTSRCTFSYYPFRTLTYAVDYQIWGLDSGRFKLTNALIHLVNVWLCFWLVLRVFRKTLVGPANSAAWDISMATTAAACLAIHPVVVEPVVWVPGREELLMTLGALGCLHFHLSALRTADRGAQRFKVIGLHAAAALAAAMACLCNAVAAVIPLLIVAWDLLLVSRPKRWAAIAGTVPLWAIGIATVVIKRMTEVDHNVSYSRVFSEPWLAYIISIYGLNLKTVVWPTGLVMYYDWPTPTGLLDPAVLLGVLAVALTGTVLWLARRNRALLFGLCWFLLALAPVSQIMPHHISRADRFLYLPMVGLVVAVAVVLRGLPRLRTFSMAKVGVAAVALGVLGALSSGQVHFWKNSTTWWAHCVRTEPNNGYAHARLAGQLAAADQFDQAVWHYRVALRFCPNHADTLAKFAWTLATCRDPARRDYDLAIRLARQACQITGWKEPRIQRKLSIVCTNLADELVARGEYELAILEYRRAIQADPDYDVPLFNSALLLTTCPDKALRRADEATRHAERARRLTDSIDSHRLAILAAAYAEGGQFGNAVATIKEAIQASRHEGDQAMTEELEYMQHLYRNDMTVETDGG